MISLPSFSIWSHQIYRRLRSGSLGGAIFEVAYFGFAALFLLAVIYLLVFVLPGTEFMQEIQADAAGWLQAYGFGICAAIFMANLWLSGQQRGYFGAYKHFPLSLRWISVTLQLVHAARVRYLAVFALVVGFYLFVIGYVQPEHALMAAVATVALDSASLIVRLLSARHEKLIFGFTVLLIAVAVLDAVANQFSSRAIYSVFMLFGLRRPTIVILTIAATMILVVSANKLIQDELRYGR